MCYKAVSFCMHYTACNFVCYKVESFCMHYKAESFCMFFKVIILYVL